MSHDPKYDAPEFPPLPQDRLAALIGGTVTDASTIAVGDDVVVITYPSGTVRAFDNAFGNVWLGTISDGPDALAAAYRAVTQ